MGGKALRRTSVNRMDLRVLSVLTVIAAALLSACAGPGLSGKTPEELVARRAQERMDALLAQDIDKALSYTTPAFRERTTSGRYAGRYAGVVNWQEAKVDRVDCEAERCNVRVLVTYQLPRPRITNTRPLDEVWIKVDGKWYIYHQ